MNRYEQMIFDRTGERRAVQLKTLAPFSYATADLFTRKIELAQGFADAPDLAIEATLLHEVGHLKDKLLHGLFYTMLLSLPALLVGILTGFTPLSLLALTVLLGTSGVRLWQYDLFEARADEWAAQHFSGGVACYAGWKAWSRKNLSGVGVSHG